MRSLAVGAIVALLTGGARAQFQPGVATNFAYLAGAAYCDGTSINTWSCNPCQSFASSVQSASFAADTSLSVYGYAAQANDGTAIVAFRGTDPSQIENWIVDLNASKSEIYPGCSGCEVHSGFYTGYLALASQILAALDGMGAANGPFLIVTGHSLGAAMGTIAAFELAAAGYPLTQVINFGSPRVGNPAFAVAYEALVVNGAAADVAMRTREEVAAMRASGAVRVSPIMERALSRAAHSGSRSALRGADAAPGNASLKFDVGKFQGAGMIRVTHAADPVPHVPMEWMGFQHVPQEVWYTEDQSSYTVCDATNGEDPSCSDSNWFDLSVPDHLHYMNLYISNLC